MIDWIGPEAAAHIFHTTKQEKLRLDAALKGYFAETEKAAVREMPHAESREVSQAGLMEEYAAYLRKRIRPAARQLIELGELGALRRLIREGFLPEAVRHELALQAAREERAAAWLCLQDAALSSSMPDSAVPDSNLSDPAASGTSALRSGVPDSAAPDSDALGFNMSCAAVLSSAASDAEAVLRETYLSLYDLFPFLDCALAALTPRAYSSDFPLSRDVPSACSGDSPGSASSSCDGSCSGNVLSSDSAPPPRTMGTDGFFLYYDPVFVCACAGQDSRRLTRLCLHIVLHCILRHWSVPEAERDKTDLSVERMIEEECVRRGECWSRLGESILKELPHPDDHGLWPADADTARARAQRSALDQRWAAVKELCGSPGRGGEGGLGLAGSLGIGSAAGTDRVRIAPGSGRGAGDYRRFLSRFAVSREEAELDLESFDYIYYSLGMERYRNLPLIEPLEYREGHKLEELVIAIDTSGSCSAELIRRFLTESYEILGRKENFFRKMKVYFIQCDCVIQDVALIRSPEDWKRYCEELTIKGRSGTDFTPVFRYVETLRQSRQLKDLKCLIYFTDGDGVYPRQPTDYETAFVFLRAHPAQEHVLSWITKLFVNEKQEDLL